MAALVEAVRLALAPPLLASQAAVFIDVSNGLCVRCVPNMLRSVVYNLLSYASKYQAPDRLPVVHLRGHAAGQLVLAVQANGLGLSPVQQQHLFRMFQRLHTHVEGSGVGLYMVKHLVENAGGTITVQSEPGVGAAFMVQLPVA